MVQTKIITRYDDEELERELDMVLSDLKTCEIIDIKYAIYDRLYSAVIIYKIVVVA